MTRPRCLSLVGDVSVLTSRPAFSLCDVLHCILPPGFTKPPDGGHIALHNEISGQEVLLKGFAQ